jgi:beta-phosphoglucomutase
MIKAFIFDLDGVITDTAEFHYIAWKKLAERESWEFNREINEALRGISRLDSIRVILKHNDLSDQFTDEEAGKLANDKNVLYVESLAGVSPDDYLPGAKELLEELKSRGYKIALGSASKNAVQVLARLDALHYFDVIGDGTKAEKSKPAPDVFLYSAKELGLSPDECVVVEDAYSGVDAAIAGGFYSVGVGPKERVGHATISFDAMDQIDLDAVFEACQ